MCRNIRTLFNFEPPATEEEIRASALQFVRKLSGFTHPSQANEAAFHRAVEEVARCSPAAADLTGDREPGQESRSRSHEGAGQSAGAICLSDSTFKPLRFFARVAEYWEG